MAGQDLGTASGSANRLLSRTVTVSVGPPSQDADTKAPAAPASARMPAWPPPTGSYGREPILVLPSSPPGLPRLAKRAAVIRDRGERDLEAQVTARP
jgi:hypothetical protein